MSDPWQSSWNSRDQDYTHRDAKDVLEKSNILGDIYGAFSGGHKDPIQQWGDSMLGNNGFDTIRWQPGDEDVYKQMDEQQWRDLGSMRQDNQREWIRRRAEALKNGAQPGVFWDPKTGKTMPGAGMGGPAEDPMDAKINEFYKRMMGPLDMNDPEVQQATNNATSIANREAANRGIAGGMSVTGATQAGLQAQAGLQQFRQGLGMQALGMQANRDMGLKNLALQKYGMQGQNELAAYQSKQANMQGLGSIIGGMYGGAAGAQIGGSIGGMAGGSYHPTPDPSYKGGTY